MFPARKVFALAVSIYTVDHCVSLSDIEKVKEFEITALKSDFGDDKVLVSNTVITTIVAEDGDKYSASYLHKFLNPNNAMPPLGMFFNSDVSADTEFKFTYTGILSQYLTGKRILTGVEPLEPAPPVSTGFAHITR